PLEERLVMIEQPAHGASSRGGGYREGGAAALAPVAGRCSTWNTGRTKRRQPDESWPRGTSSPRRSGDGPGPARGSTAAPAQITSRTLRTRARRSDRTRRDRGGRERPRPLTLLPLRLCVFACSSSRATTCTTVHLVEEVLPVGGAASGERRRIRGRSGHRLRPFLRRPPPPERPRAAPALVPRRGAIPRKGATPPPPERQAAPARAPMEMRKPCSHRARAFVRACVGS